MEWRVFLFAVFLFFPSVSCADLNADLSQVTDFLYNLEFDRAYSLLDEMNAAYSSHPAVSFYKGIVRYEGFRMGISKSKKNLKTIYEDLALCQKKAKFLRESEPAQAEYYWGSCNAYRARILASSGHAIKAVPSAKRGLKHLKKAVHLDSGLDDAYLALGMYYYFMDRTPAFIKPFAFLMGFRGNREKGLKYIQRAAEKGESVSMQAKAALAAIYSSDEEGLWEEAERILDETMRLYTRHPADYLRRAYVNGRLGRWEAAVQYADPAGAWRAALPSPLSEIYLASFYYRRCESLLYLGRLEEAEKYLDELEWLSLSGDLGNWVQLRRANLSDALGNREEAEEVYRNLKGSEVSKLAKQYLKKSFPGETIRLMPFEEEIR